MSYHLQKSLSRAIPYALMMFVTMLVSGCTYIETINDDYLKAEQWDDDTFNDTMSAIKYDYLKAEQPVLDRKRTEEVLLIAKDLIINTGDAEQYHIHEPVIDHDPGMPEAFDYNFIYFEPRELQGQKPQKVYLVVLTRFENHIVYSGLYEFPEGDHFYRYNKILEKIQN